MQGTGEGVGWFQWAKTVKGRACANHTATDYRAGNSSWKDSVGMDRETISGDLFAVGSRGIKRKSNTLRVEENEGSGGMGSMKAGPSPSASLRVRMTIS